MNQRLLMNSLIAGLIALFFGVVITYGVHLVNPTTNLDWTMIAIGFASFFAGFFGYMGGARREEQEMRQT